jgi:leucyl aminopeptidase
MPAVGALAVPVHPGEAGAEVAAVATMTDDGLAAEARAFLDTVEHTGAGGVVALLHRPTRQPGPILFVGVGHEDEEPGRGVGEPAARDGDEEFAAEVADERCWRLAGAAMVRAARRLSEVTFVLPDALTHAPDRLEMAVRAFAEGAWLASYRFRLSEPAPEDIPKLHKITIVTPRKGETDKALRHARAVVDATLLARDLTNTPSLQKSPAWLAERIQTEAAGRRDVTVRVRDEADLAREGFGGVLAVGGGSARPPRLVEVSYRPRGARRHVVLVGKGITFDSGGISIKPPEGMRLMRKDMGGAAAVCATVLGAAALRLPVRLTAVAPLAENMISGSAFRPGDVVRHYGGITTEVQNTDAEGRVILGDALAYVARTHDPDFLVDLATLTGASHVALGKRIAALYTENDTLADGLIRGGEAVGERVWRMPLLDEYVPLLASSVADLNNAPTPSQAGSVVAALYLREFTEQLRDRWAHIDMSAPAWFESIEGPLVRGATGWGVRILLRWLASL